MYVDNLQGSFSGTIYHISFFTFFCFGDRISLLTVLELTMSSSLVSSSEIHLLLPPPPTHTSAGIKVMCYHAWLPFIILCV